jgi:NitT/TauT family transport system permease protein
MSTDIAAPREEVSARAAADPALAAGRSTWRYRLGSLAIVIAVIALWELLPRAGLVSEVILPPFTEVATALGTLVAAEFFPGHLGTTLSEMAWGFVLGTTMGFVLGTLLAVWQPVKRLIYPFIVGFQAVPKIVFAPLFIAWFGYGQSSKIVMAIAISFFPVLINTLVGLESVPNDAVRLMRSLRATSGQTFWKISLPHAMPIIFAGIKAALTFAVTGAIVGEFVGSSEGLGYLLNLYNFQLRIDRVFAVILVLSAIGAFGYFLLEWVDRRLITWREDDV